MINCNGDKNHPKTRNYVSIRIKKNNKLKG